MADCMNHPDRDTREQNRAKFGWHWRSGTGTGATAPSSPPVAIDATDPKTAGQTALLNVLTKLRAQRDSLSK